MNMRATIKINCDTEPFTEKTGAELARILRQLADNIQSLGNEDFDASSYNRYLPLRDIGGVKVGYFHIR